MVGKISFIGIGSGLRYVVCFLDSYEIEINGKLIFSKHHLGEYPDNAEIVEISKWGNMGKSFLHMYLCSVAEGGQQRMIITDKKNTPLPKRMIMLCSIS